MTKTFFFLSFILCSMTVLAFPSETYLNYKGHTFSHYVSHDLTVPNSKIENVILSIHGSERNADTYFKSIEAMTIRQGEIEKTIIISPHFKEAHDTLRPQELYFSPEGWLSGDEALNDQTVSSFSIMDYIISLLGDQKIFPNLKKITLTGHSAGGQLIQRYAAGTGIDKKYPDVHFRYIVANPGSYVYLTKNRPVKSTLKCNFNDYKYGLDRLNSYMTKNLPFLKSQYVAKEVIYFLGEQDIISENIDQSCPAQFQGKTRLERGKFFKAQLETEFPQAKHHLITVPGVGHTQYGMYTSALGAKVLFQEI